MCAWGWTDEPGAGNASGGRGRGIASNDEESRPSGREAVVIVAVAISDARAGGEGLPCRVRRRRRGTRGGARECARREPALARRNARRGMARATAPAEAHIHKTLGTRTVDRRGLGSSEREGFAKGVEAVKPIKRTGQTTRPATSAVSYRAVT